MSAFHLDASKLEHGTRARYVRGCRCDLCRRENTRSQRARRRAAQLIAHSGEVEPNGPPRTKRFRRLIAGQRRKVRVPVCPGTEGRPCIAGGAWLQRGRLVCMACVRRSRVWNGLVPADRARRHLKKLSAARVGTLAIAAASDLSTNVIGRVRRGAKTMIRAATEKRILAVDEAARSDGAFMPRAPSLALLHDLAQRGFSQEWISRQLGTRWCAAIYRKHRRFVRARTALAIEKLHRRVAAGLVSHPSFEDAEPTYRIIRQLLERVPREPLKQLLGYRMPWRQPRRVRKETAERVRAFAAELERRRVEGEPLPDDWQVSRITAAFGYEGGWQWERRQGKRARKREERELRKLARRRA